MYRLIKTLKDLVSLKPIWVDMCINLCCAFTGNFKTLNKCIYCKAERYRGRDQSRAQVTYFPFEIDLSFNIKIQYMQNSYAIVLNMLLEKDMVLMVSLVMCLMAFDINTYHKQDIFKMIVILHF